MRIKNLILTTAMLLTLTACGNDADVKEIAPTEAVVQIQTNNENTGGAEPTDAPAEDITKNPDVTTPSDDETTPVPTEADVTAAPDVTTTEVPSDSEITPEPTKAPVEATPTEAPKPAGTFTSADCSITISGVSLSLGMDFLPYVDKLGNAVIEEGQACLDGGYDTNYYYGNTLTVYTYAKDGKQIIYDIYITGSEYKTDKGAQIGTTTKDKLHEIYGEATNSLPSTERYSVSGSSALVSFTFSSDVLSAIDILDSEVN